MWLRILTSLLIAGLAVGLSFGLLAIGGMSCMTGCPKGAFVPAVQTLRFALVILAAHFIIRSVLLLAAGILGWIGTPGIIRPISYVVPGLFYALVLIAVWQFFSELYAMDPWLQKTFGPDAGEGSAR